MALDVQSSLASTLFTPDRAAANRTKAADQTGKSASRPATLPGEAETSANFSSYVGDKNGNGVGKSAARPATQPPARKLMPGQIAGHQDTKVGATDTTADANKPAQTVGENDTATARSVAEGAQDAARAEAAKARAGDENTGAQAKAGEAADSAPEGAHAEGADANTALVQAESDGQGNASSGDKEKGETGSEQQTAATDAAPTDAAPVIGNTVPTPVVVATTSGAVIGADGSAKTSADASTAVDDSIKAVGATGVDAGKPATQPQNPDTGVLATDAGSTDATSVEAGTKNQVSTPVVLPAADGAQETDKDTTLQPGMTQQVEARKEANAEAPVLKPGDTSGIKAEKSDGTTKGVAEGATDTPRANHHEGLKLGGAVFQQVLDGFAGSHGLNRANNLLSQLDPSVAAQAQNARASDVARPTPLQMLPIEIGMQAVRGAREFQIRLDPAELGRVDVKLHINDKGEVNASMIVERPETLQMLRRDATTLTQAFEQAGLKQGENSLSFSLRGEGQDQQQQQQGNGGRASERDDPALNAQVAEIVSRRVMIPNSSLDLMV